MADHSSRPVSADSGFNGLGDGVDSTGAGGFVFADLDFAGGVVEIAGDFRFTVAVSAAPLQPALFLALFGQSCPMRLEGCNPLELVRRVFILLVAILRFVSRVPTELLLNILAGGSGQLFLREGQSSILHQAPTGQAASYAGHVC
jgi:hypothetical protein